MLIRAKGKPNDIMTYTDSSVTRDQLQWGFTVRQGGQSAKKDSGAYEFTSSSLTIEAEAVWPSIVTQRSLLHHCHRLKVNLLQNKWILRWAALICTAFGSKDYLDSTAIASTKSEGINWQMDRKAELISQVVETWSRKAERL